MLCQRGNKTVPVKFNTRRGRYCFKYSSEQERENIKIEYEGKEFKVRKSKDLVDVYEKTVKVHKDFGAKSNFELVMRTTGMCLWSWPIGKQELNALWVMSNSMSDFGVKLPYPDLPLDEQPNLFFEFYSVFASAKNDYMERKSGNSS